MENEIRDILETHGLTDESVRLLVELYDKIENKIFDDISEIYRKPLSVLKPLYYVYRAENPNLDKQYFIPDSKVFYAWIVKKIMKKKEEISLPEFLYKDDIGNIYIGGWGDTDVTDIWSEWINKQMH